MIGGRWRPTPPLFERWVGSRLPVSVWPTIRYEAIGPIGRGQSLLTLQAKFAASLVLPLPL